MWPYTATEKLLTITSYLLENFTQSTQLYFKQITARSTARALTAAVKIKRTAKHIAVGDGRLRPRYRHLANLTKHMHPGLPPRTFACTVSSELLGFLFLFFHYFSFLGRALD